MTRSQSLWVQAPLQSSQAELSRPSKYNALPYVRNRSGVRRQGEIMRLCVREREQAAEAWVHLQLMEATHAHSLVMSMWSPKQAWC